VQDEVAGLMPGLFPILGVGEPPGESGNDISVQEAANHRREQLMFGNKTPSSKAGKAD
jgi:hypothetical protein